MRKLSPVLAVLLCFSLLLTVPIVSAEATNVKTIKLKVNYIEVPISENIRVVRSEDDNSAKVQLFNKETGELIETFGEIIESVTPAPNSLSSDNTLAENLILQAYNERTDYKNVTTRLTVKMEGYRSGSFVQINKVLSNKLAIVNSNKPKFRKYRSLKT